MNLTCDICGGKLIVGSGGVVVCESCGMEYTQERIREKTQGISTESIELDDSIVVGKEEIHNDYIENWRTIASEDYENGNYDEAYDYYLKILEVSPSDYDATWHKGLCIGWKATADDPQVSVVMGGIVDAIDKLYSSREFTDSEEYNTITGIIMSLDDWVQALDDVMTDYIHPEGDDWHFTDAMANHLFNTWELIALGLSKIILSIKDSFYVGFSSNRTIDNTVELFNMQSDMCKNWMDLELAVYDMQYYMEHDDVRLVSANDEQKKNVEELQKTVNRLIERVPIIKERRKEKMVEKRKAELALFFADHKDEEKQYNEVKEIIKDYDKKIDECQSSINDLNTSLDNYEKSRVNIIDAIDNLEKEIAKLKHKIIARSKALEEAANKQEELDRYNRSLVEIDKNINDIHEKKTEQEGLLEQLKKKRHYAYIDRKVLFKKWGIVNI